MSAAHSSDFATNHHIATLQSMLASTATFPEWLIITHDDQNLECELLSASGGQPAALLKVHQDEWDNRLLQDAVAWALRHLDLADIVLAGHSQTGPIPEELLATAGGNRSHHSEPEGVYHRLADGARQFSREIERANRRFAAQADCLLASPEVQRRLQAGDLRVHTILYRADSGLFFAYRPDCGDFVPLG